MCKYVYYDNTEIVKPKMYCKLNNKICLYSKFCVNQNKYIPKEGMENCYMVLQEEKKTIPSGSYYVRFIKKGFLYVEIGNSVIKIKDTLGTVTNYVYVKQTPNGYEIALQPFTYEISNEQKETKRRTYNRKKKDA
jgi:hypothetical protein